MINKLPPPPKPVMPKPPYNYLFTLDASFRKSALMLALRDEGFARGWLPRIPLGYFEGDILFADKGKATIDDAAYTWIQVKAVEMVERSGRLPSPSQIVRGMMHEANKEMVGKDEEDKKDVLKFLGRVLKHLLTDEPDVPFESITEDIEKGIQAYKLGEFLGFVASTLDVTSESLDKSEFDKRYYDAVHGASKKVTHTSFRETFKDAINTRKRVERIPTGLKHLDAELLGGIPCGEIAVLGAETGAGKTTMLASFAAQALKAGHLVGYVTLETSGDNIKNMVSAQYSRIRRNDLPLSKGKAEDRVEDVLNSLPPEADLLVMDVGPGGIGAAGIRVWLEQLRMSGAQVPKAIFVDYLNNMKMGNKQDQKYVAYRDEMTALAGIAHDFNIVIWIAAQLNREGSGKRVPGLEDFAGSWDMLNVPPTVLLFYHPESDKNSNIRGLRLAKTKSGNALPVYDVMVDFALTQFMESPPKASVTSTKKTAPLGARSLTQGP